MSTLSLKKQMKTSTKLFHPLPHRKLCTLRLFFYLLLILLLFFYTFLQFQLETNKNNSDNKVNNNSSETAFLSSFTRHIYSTFRYLIYNIESSISESENYQLGLIWTTYFGNGYIEEDLAFYNQISLEDLGKSKNLSNSELRFLPLKLLKDLDTLTSILNFGNNTNDNSRHYLYQPKMCASQYPRCFFTSNRTLANLAQTIVFHWNDVEAKDLPEEEVEFEDQTNNPDLQQTSPQRPLWVLYNLEPPWLSHQLPELNPANEKPITFDLVANYRSDATLFMPYGQVIPKKAKKSQNKEEEEVLFYSEKPTFENKSKQAVWFVSNCVTASKREEYVQQLMESAVVEKDGKRGNISVDILGHCGPAEQQAGACVPKHSPKCYREIEQQYRFYLSFENAVCKDYVTEKLFNALQYHMLPVVLGGASYSALLPPHSYLDATKMSPKNLATVLRRLTANQTEYESYFRWKEDYEVVSEGQVQHNLRLACHLCELMEKKQKKKMKKVARKGKIWIRKNPTFQTSTSPLSFPITTEEINSWFFAEDSCWNEAVPLQQ